MKHYSPPSIPTVPSIPTISTTTPTLHSEPNNVYPLRLRRFYAFWSLKEAHIKMIGSGLLAPWLQDLEFLNVIAPPPPPSNCLSAEEEPDDGFSWALRGIEDAEEKERREAEKERKKWTAPEQSVRGIKAVLYGKVIDDVELEIVAFEEDFLMATAIRGVTERVGAEKRWIKLDIDKDIRACAEGRCRCLEMKPTRELTEYGVEKDQGSRTAGGDVPYP
jgi:4'-phosphopantetheinyl transferase